jgi:fumarylacetoacetase
MRKPGIGWENFLDIRQRPAGALIELTTGGKNPLSLPGGERRAFLEDGDTVILRGWCERPGSARIGFGECRGTVLPSAGVP